MNLKTWSRKLLSSVIQGGSHAGSAYLGLAVAHAADANIPALSVKALCVVVVTSGVLKFFQFLDVNPLPPDEETLTVTVTKTTPHVEESKETPKP